MIDAFDFQHGKIVLEAVIAEVVSERPFGLADVGIDRAADDEVGLGRHGEASLGRDHGNAPASECSGERELGQPFGQRHDRGDRQARAGRRRRRSPAAASPRRIAAAWCTPIPRWIW